MSLWSDTDWTTRKNIEIGRMWGCCRWENEARNLPERFGSAVILVI